MHTGDHMDLKKLILTSWKERWNERKWSVHIKRYMKNPSDVFFIADTLVLQTFIGTEPNAKLLSYVWNALSTGLLSYSAVLTAISKHEDLHKVESTKGVYSLLIKSISVINSHVIVEDSMDLCSSLRMIVQWLLRNIEQYLKGVHDVYKSTAQELIRLNCKALEHITNTGSRTSSLLTIARFEESGFWNNIETDLAVVKNTAGQHALHAEIRESCQHVSQLSRCSIKPKPSYMLTSSTLCLPLTGLFMFEVHERNHTDVEAFAQQVMLLSKIHGIDMSNLLFHIIQTCFLGYLDAVENKQNLEKEWCAMILLRLPKLFLHLRSNNDEASLEPGLSSMQSAQFELHMCGGLQKLLNLSGLFNTLDQLREGLNWFAILTDQFVKHDLLSDTIAEKYKEQRNCQLNLMAANTKQDKCSNPLTIIKFEGSVKQIINVINFTDFAADAERLYSTFEKISSYSSFDTILSSAIATSQLHGFIGKLLSFNESMKTTTGETSKAAQIRASLFDVTFLMTCHTVRLYGKVATLGPQSFRKVGVPYICQWINTRWADSVNHVQTAKMETDPARVETLIAVLRSSTEFKLSMTKWNDICSNLPQAMLDMVYAHQKCFISASDVKKACIFIRDNCPMSVILSVVIDLSQYQRLVLNSKSMQEWLGTLCAESEQQQKNGMLYYDRYFFFKDIVGHLCGTELPDFSSNSILKMRPSVILENQFMKTRNRGWLNHESYDMLSKCLKFLGTESFTRKIFSLILKENRLVDIHDVTDIVYAVLRMDIEPMVMYLLKYAIPGYFTSETHALSPPAGNAISKIAVCALEIALNDAVLRHNSLLISDRKLGSFFQETSPGKLQDHHAKVRRLLSCSTEHDLSSSFSSSLPSSDPLLIIVSNFLEVICENMESGICSSRSEFAFTFVKDALYGMPILSRTVKQLLPTKALKLLSKDLVKNGRELLFAACDLGNPEVRRIAADAICHVDCEKNIFRT